jgi:CrcB protein
MLNKFWLLLIGGGVGTVCRYFLAEWGQARWGVHLPYGTLLVNMAGCCLMGILLGVLESRFGALDSAPYALRLLLISGFLGGLTTFSSYELETFLLFRHGAWERALLYALGSVALGLLVMLGGFRLTRLLMGGRL